MGDRELLELAAKAAGLSLEWGDKYQLGDDVIDCTDIPYARGSSPDESPYHWNPLEDDGDALRLAVDLDIELVFKRKHAEACCESRMGPIMVEYHDGENLGDRRAATRRAIVRAAAELARSTTTT